MCLLLLRHHLIQSSHQYHKQYCCHFADWQTEALRTKVGCGNGKPKQSDSKAQFSSVLHVFSGTRNEVSTPAGTLSLLCAYPWVDTVGQKEAKAMCLSFPPIFSKEGWLKWYSSFKHRQLSDDTNRATQKEFVSMLKQYWLLLEGGNVL